MLARFEEMGFSDKELQADSSFLAASRGRRFNGLWQAVLSWIQDLAPVIIHVNIDTVGRFLESDEYYRTSLLMCGTATAQMLLQVLSGASLRPRHHMEPSMRATWRSNRTRMALAFHSYSVLPRGRTGNQTRITWERDLFGDAYDDAKPFERCKYGALNVTGSISRGAGEQKREGTKARDTSELK